MNHDIETYNAAQSPVNRPLCACLAAEMAMCLPTSESKVWHGSPVWFIDGNPVAGYAARKTHVQLLFWSGQSFDEAQLHPEGKFQAAEARYTSVDDVKLEDLRRWLEKARRIQWDYKNIVKRRGVLEKIGTW